MQNLRNAMRDAVVNITEAEMLHALTKGLRADYAFEMKHRKGAVAAKTMTTFQAACSYLCAVVELDDAPLTAAPTGAFTASTPAPPESEIQKLSANLAALTMAGASMARIASNPPPELRHPRNPKTETRQCYKCGEFGHISPNCPTSQQAPPQEARVWTPPPQQQ